MGETSRTSGKHGEARWGTATWSTFWDVVASWSLATMRSCFLDFAANDGFGENSQAVKMKNLCWMWWNRGFPFFVKFGRSTRLFPGDVLWQTPRFFSYLRKSPKGCPSSWLDHGRGWLWKYSGCIPTPKRLHVAQNELRADVVLKNKKHWTVLQYPTACLYTSWSWYCKVLL